MSNKWKLKPYGIISRMYSYASEHTVNAVDIGTNMSSQSAKGAANPGRYVLSPHLSDITHFSWPQTELNIKNTNITMCRLCAHHAMCLPPLKRFNDIQRYFYCRPITQL